jgi:hypothetical protein
VRPIGDRLRSSATLRENVEPRRSRDLLATIEAALKDPAPSSSLEEFESWQHLDVARLSLDELDDERWRLRTARAFGLLTEWGHERLAVLDRASGRQRRTAG